LCSRFASAAHGRCILAVPGASLAAGDKDQSATFAAAESAKPAKANGAQKAQKEAKEGCFRHGARKPQIPH
jgi:hypothetical protein